MTHTIIGWAVIADGVLQVHENCCNPAVFDDEDEAYLFVDELRTFGEGVFKVVRVSQTTEIIGEQA